MTGKARRNDPAKPVPGHLARLVRLHTAGMLLRTGLFTAGALCSVLLAVMVFWMLGPYLVADPMTALERQTPARKYLDGQKRLLFLQPTYDYQYRLPVPLSEISKPVIQAVIAAEDAGFYSHNGVDGTAILRALRQNLQQKRIVSGASTITMQLAGLAEPGRRRSWWRKLRQAFQARTLEKKYSKNRILEEYLNRVPFGGKLYGVEAAAWHYFGKPAARLNISEASMLCGLPQKPNAFRPDRHLERARKRQKMVLQMMERRGLLPNGEAVRIFQHEALLFRDFRFPSPLKQWSTSRDGMYYSLACAEADAAFTLTCHLDPVLDDLLFRTIKEQAGRLPGVRDGAAVLLESGSGNVLAMTGTLDFSSPLAGQVNAATAVRSAGSALKPFLYAEALDGGILVEDSMLLDAPVRYGEYSPGNYDRRFHGRVRAGEALSLSLNTPAVRLLATLGPKRLAERFATLQLWTGSASGTSQDHQLSMVLGTAGHSLLGMTTAYATIARGGEFRPAGFSGCRSSVRQAVFTPGCCAMLSRMLRRRPLPGSTVEVSWKTGTSNGNHDAWCFAYTPEFTLGVWFGNKDGAPAAVLTGAGAAAPAAGAMMSALYRNRPLPAWPPENELFRSENLCSASGLTASPGCQEIHCGTALRDIPLRRCNLCRKGGTVSPVMILSPAPGHYLTNPGEAIATLTLRAEPPEVLWYVDHQYAGPLPPASRLPFAAGRHVLHAVDAAIQENCARVEFSVGRP